PYPTLFRSLSIGQHLFGGGRELQERSRGLIGEIGLGGALRPLSHIAKLAAPAQPPAPDFTALQQNTCGPSTGADLLNRRHLHPGGAAMVHIEKLALLIHHPPVSEIAKRAAVPLVSAPSFPVRRQEPRLLEPQLAAGR